MQEYIKIFKILVATLAPLNCSPQATEDVSTQLQSDHSFPNYITNIKNIMQSTYPDRDNLSGGLLELLQLSQEVPETGLGDDGVRREDPHLV